MIIEDLGNTNSMTRSGECITSQHVIYDRVVTPTKPSKTHCITAFSNPTIYKSKVFGHTADATDTYKNDQTSFLFTKLITSDTYSLELWKEGVKVADLTDDTYGKYFGVGFTALYPLYYGYRLDWERVLTLEGAGCYTLRNSATILGVSTVVDSCCYYLLPYDDCSAAGTVKIFWKQNGNIESNPIKYAGLAWYNWIRVPSIFWNNAPTEEIDEIEKTSRKFENIQVQSVDEFTLDIKSIPFCVSKIFDKNICLATEIEVTDYNPDNHRDDLVDFPIRFSGYGDRDEQRGNYLARFSYKFKKRTDNDLKREFPRPYSDIK
jgi:hypothetical protein